MNKTVSMNLGGQVFQIDEHAYERLFRYLESIKTRYANTKGGDDIIWDIENRLAEMFYEYLGTGRQVVSMNDVEKTMAVMGRPEDFEVPLEDEDEDARMDNPQTSSTKKQRRLFRNNEDKIIAGVASGISAYFGIHDPIWIRIAFVIAFFASYGTAVVVYLILVIIIPKATTASEKLQMRGEPINIDNIERTVRDELNDLEARLNNGKSRGTLSRGVDYLASGLRIFFLLLGKIIGFCLAALGVLLLISLVLGISIPSVIKGGIAPSMFPHLFDSTATLVAAIVGFTLLLLIPILALIYSGLSLLLNRPLRYRGLGLAAFGLLVVGLLLTIYSVSKVSSDFDVERSRTETLVLSQPIDGILRLHTSADPRNQDEFKTFTGFGLFRVENDTIYVRNNMIDNDEKPIVLDVVRSPSNEFILETTISAKGDASETAHQRSMNIQYQPQQDSAHLYFPTYLAYAASDKIRGQQVRLTVKVPEGKSIYLSKEVRELIYDIKNVGNMYDGNMVGHTWTMMAAGLTCLDCGEDGLGHPTPPTPPNAPLPPPPSSSISVPQPAFTSLKIDGAFKFYLAPADESRIVFGDAEMEKLVSVNHSGNTLTITNNKTIGLLGDEVVIWVYTPKVTKVIALGACEGSVNGFAADDFYMELAGASECRLNVTTNTLDLHVSGASELSATGIANSLNAEAAGASHIEAFGLMADKAKVHTSGASSAEVSVQSQLDAEAVGASSIDYKGSPKVSSSDGGFSSINQKP